MFKYTVLSVFIASFAVISALKPEDELILNAAALPFLHTCTEEFGVSEKDLLAAKENKNIDALNSCFYNCFFKKAGLIKEDGLFDTEFAEVKNKEFFKNEESLKAISNIIKKCAAVNDQDVADECERSKLLLRCIDNERSA